MTQSEFGWSMTSIPGKGVHVVPINDTYDHMDTDCPCRPVRDPDSPLNVTVWMLTSFDGREAFETGERKAS